MDLKAHYRRRFEAHGPSAEAVQWSSLETQQRRFEILTEITQNLGSVMDVGAGLGDLLVQLRAGGWDQAYLGFDFVEEFVRHAQEKFQADTKASFATLDLWNDELPSGYEWILLSGVFNNEMDDNWGFLTQSLRKMFAAAEKGVAFNALSTYVDYQDKGLYYVDPLKVFDFCKRELTKKATLRHDYLVKAGSIPFEFTIYLYK